MKYLLLVTLLVVSIAPSLAQTGPADYKTAQAEAIKDPSVVQFDQQIAQLQAQLDQLNAIKGQAGLKRDIVNDMTQGYSGWQPSWGHKPRPIDDFYSDGDTNQASIDAITKQITAVKVARTQALWTKIEQINPALQPVVEELRKIAAQAAAANQAE